MLWILYRLLIECIDIEKTIVSLMFFSLGHVLCKECSVIIKNKECSVIIKNVDMDCFDIISVEALSFMETSHYEEV